MDAGALAVAARVEAQKDARIAELEAALRKWREHYKCNPTPDGVYILVPAYQIDELLGQK